MFLVIDIAQEIAIPQVDRERLLKQMEMAENYEKSRHISCCLANSTYGTHCCTFGLCNVHCAQHYSECSQEHNSICSDCTNIIGTLDEIKQKFEKLTNLDL